VKIKKSQLKELIRQAIVEDIMDKEIKNPKTGNKIKVRTALQLPGDHPVNKLAKKLVAKSTVVDVPSEYPKDDPITTPADDKEKEKRIFL